MTAKWIEGIREIGQYRTLIAVGLPILGGALAAAASILVPRGKARGLITGVYMLLASLGAACLLFAFAALIAGEPGATLIPLFVPGIVLTVVMGVFSPEIIRQYRQFEFRKLTAGIFRRT
jgi:drug/metabolite transporter (DMT)-like permease